MNTPNNVENNDSKQLSQKYDTKSPTNIKDAVRALLLQQKENILTNV